MSTEYMKEKALDFDFSKQLSSEAKKTVYATGLHQRFLFERKRVEDMVRKILDEDQSLNNKALLNASRPLDKLVLQLQKIIEHDKTRVGDEANGNGLCR